MRIGVDVDGVLADWTTQAKEILEYEYPGIKVPEPTHWDYLDELGTEKWNWLWSPDGGLARGLFRDQIPLVHNIEALQNCLHDVVIITKIPPESRINRMEWLTQQYIPQIKEIHLMWKGDSKASVSCDAYIDDYEVNCYEIAKAHPTKLVALMDQPWNQAAEIHPYPNIRRVSSVAEFLSLLDNQST